MVQRLYVNNYKCLVNFELHLQELSLLLGPSGVGKTAVLDIMYALRRLLSGDARVTDAHTFPTRTLTRWQRQDLQIFEIDVRLESGDFTYRLEVEHERPSKKARIHVERLTADGRPLFECSQGEVKLYRDNHSPGPNYAADWSESALARVAPRGDNTRLTSFLEFMRKVLVCGIHPPSIVTESDGEAPLLERDGRNFSDWYRHVLQERPDLAHEFTNTLKQALGAELKGIRLERIGHETRALLVAFVDREDVESQESYELRFEEISDGQRALVALYGLTQLSSDQGYTLFLDEPENYVALAEIQPWLMNLEDACGATLSQAVITSHHPELIDYLGCEHGVLLDKEVSGVVTTRKLHVGADTDGLRLRTHRQGLGGMSRKVHIVLLCEDQQQQAFMRRFLVRTGWETRNIRVEMAPRGRCSAEKFVRSRFPKELTEHRRRSVSRALVTMIDGDDKGVERRMAQLERACPEQERPIGQPGDDVLVLVPTWNIETWIAYLDGQSVDEQKDDYPRLRRPRECAPHVAALVDMCQQGKLREPAPSSLTAACTEYRRWVSNL